MLYNFSKQIYYDNCWNKKKKFDLFQNLEIHFFKSFTLTEEEYILRLDIANMLKCWGAVSHICNSLAKLKERPRILKFNIFEVLFMIPLHTREDKEVGALIVKSKTSWLSAEEICKILKQAESKNLTESVEKPPIDSIGLFIFREKKFYDHWRWNDVGGSKTKRGGNNRLGKKKKLSGNDGCSVNVMESTGLLEDNYVRRVHRDSKNFGDELAVVHYRRLT
ncbi:unnamed protein product [Brassica rapa]|uniref:CG-1 domain-containing protein n=2 Tax=Brassica campestris TaxID=3711 RepID=A0A8D9DPN9_BRACM|nr:unnamed protein product [Brassica rapa]